LDTTVSKVLKMAQQQIKQDEVICYVGRDGMTNLVCPNCKTLKTIDTSKKNIGTRKFKAKCKCGMALRGRFELRQHIRKKVNLLGSYKNPKNRNIGEIDIENISLMGVGFRCFGNPGFQKMDKLDITFTLDNPDRSVIKLRVEVVHIEGRYVGAKRCDTKSMQPTLGFYLKQTR
jgi:hypothetical protein